LISGLETRVGNIVDEVEGLYVSGYIFFAEFATEFREVLLYTGVIVLKSNLSKEKFK
jgi:hypothetical protein